VVCRQAADSHFAAERGCLPLQARRWRPPRSR
jgi:hypothetical protein